LETEEEEEEEEPELDRWVARGDVDRQSSFAL
jgi:hypothetical protein